VIELGQKTGPLPCSILRHALHPGSARGGAHRLLDYDAAKEGLARHKENQHAGEGNIDRTYRGKHLQIQFTVEDEGVFTCLDGDDNVWGAARPIGRKSFAPKIGMILFQQGLRCPTRQARFLSACCGRVI